MVPPALGAAFGALLIAWQLLLLRLRPCSEWASWGWDRAWCSCWPKVAP
jgi:hypothetical protein